MTLIGRADYLSSNFASFLRGNVARSAARRTKAPPPHNLILFEYEASPWCRLVREYLTILDLQVHIRPCPRQTLFLEGAFGPTSRFRPSAMDHLKRSSGTDDLTFPLLVDQTESIESPIVIMQSYEILQHLWERYGNDIERDQNRPDQWWNSPSIPFPLRFLSLASPSYTRPLPTYGILKTPSIWDDKKDNELILYQAEGCPESRMVREALCTLEIPYLSVAAGEFSSNLSSIPNHQSIPVLLDGDKVVRGANECTSYIWKQYRDPTGDLPMLWDRKPSPNLGRAGPFGVGAYAAFIRGNRGFVPGRALE